MKLQNRPHLSIGDFNTGRNDIDKSDAGAAFHCAEYFDHLDEAGIVDMWRHQHPHLREYSWYCAAGNGFRIDHVFGNHAMHAMVDRCWYDHAVRESGLVTSGMMIAVRLGRACRYQLL